MDIKLVFEYISNKIKILKNKEKTKEDYNELNMLFDIFFKLYDNGYTGIIFVKKIEGYNKDINNIFQDVLQDFTILSYYMNKKTEGLIISDKLTLCNTGVVDKNMIYNNIKYYLGKIPIGHKKIKLSFNIPNDINKVFHHMNFSIINSLESGYICLFRCVNYTINNNGSYNINDINNNIISKNCIVRLDNNFNIVNVHEVNDKSNINLYNNERIKGLEDGILFRKNDELWFTCTNLETNDKRIPEINLCKLDNNFNIDFRIPLVSPFCKSEKNWLPFYKDNQFNFYRCGFNDSFSIISIKGNDILNKNLKNLVINKQNYNLDFSKFKGSAGPLKFDDGYLFIFHESIPGNNSKYYYYNRFAYSDKDYIIKKLSLPFKFEDDIIEFCRSMCYKNNSNDILISVSIEDMESYLYILTFENTKDTLKELEYFSF
jgi:hypothetical protein